MKVPSPVVGNVRPATNPVGYLQGRDIPNYMPFEAPGYKAPAPADASGIGRAVVGLGGAIGALGVAWDQRQKTTDRFASLTSFNDWESQVGSELEQLKRDSPPDSKNFNLQAEALYDNSARKFLSTLPGELQEEFKVRLSEKRQGVVANSLKFQYDAQDKFFVDGVSQAYEKSKVALDPTTGGDPKLLEAEKVRLAELIEATDLPEAAKLELAQKIARGLEGIAYRQEAKKLAKEGGGKISMSPEISSTIEEAANRYGVDPNGLKTLAWIESKGDPSAQNPSSSAGGLFQFIDSTAQQYGLTNKKDAAQSADAGARLYRDNREGLRKALGREPSIGEIYLAHQQGLGGATALLTNPDQRATDIVGADAVRLNGGAPGMSAQEFANLWINKANALAGQPMLDADPRFANVAYEDRISMRADAEREAIAEINAEAAVQKAQYQSQLNDLMLAVHDGTAGQTEIDAARETWLGDFDDVAKAEAVLNKRDKDQEVLQTALVNAANPAHIWNPTGTDDKAQQDALFTLGGRAAFEARDANYVRDVWVPGAVQSHMVAPESIGLLTGMTRSFDPQQSLFGYETLAMLKNAAPQAFNTQVSEDVADNVQYWEDRKDTMPAEQLASKLRGGDTPAERDATLKLREEGNDILTAKEGGIPNIKNLVNDVVGSFDNLWTQDPALTQLPWAARALERDFRAAFIDAYELRGNTDEAVAAATQKLQKTWGVSEISGKALLMKYPPEKYNPAVGGGWGYMDGQVRQQVNLGTGTRYELLSDQQTEQEVKQGKSPSYAVVTYDESGAPRLIPDAKNNLQPKRVSFAITPEVRAQQQMEWNVKQAEARQKQAVQAVMEAKSLNTLRGLGEEVPQDMVDEMKAAQENLIRQRALAQKPLEITPEVNIGNQ